MNTHTSMDSTVSKYCTYLSPYVGFIVLKNQYGWLPSVGRMGQQCVVAEEWRGTQADIQLGNHMGLLLMYGTSLVPRCGGGAWNEASMVLHWYHSQASCLGLLPNNTEEKGLRYSSLEVNLYLGREEVVDEGNTFLEMTSVQKRSQNPSHPCLCLTSSQ